MKQRSLKFKLLCLTMGLFLLTGLAMTLLQSASFSSLRNMVMTQTSDALEEEVSRSLQYQAEPLCHPDCLADAELLSDPPDRDRPD